MHFLKDITNSWSSSSKKILNVILLNNQFQSTYIPLLHGSFKTTVKSCLMKLHMIFWIFLLPIKHPVLWQIWGRKTKEENSTNPFLYHYRCSPNKNATSFGAKFCEKTGKGKYWMSFHEFLGGPADGNTLHYSSSSSLGQI